MEGLDSSLDPASLSSDELLEALRKAGGPVGPITHDTRKVYEKKLSRMLRGEDSGTAMEPSSGDLIISLQFEMEQSAEAPKEDPAPDTEMPSHLIILPDVVGTPVEDKDALRHKQIQKPSESTILKQFATANASPAVFNSLLLNGKDKSFSTSTPKQPTHTSAITDLKELSQIESVSLLPSPPLWDRRHNVPPAREKAPARNVLPNLAFPLLSLSAEGDDDFQKKAATLTKKRELDVRIRTLYNRSLRSPNWLHGQSLDDQGRPQNKGAAAVRSAGGILRKPLPGLRWAALGLALVAVLVLWCYFNMEAPAPNPFLE